MTQRSEEDEMTFTIRLTEEERQKTRDFHAEALIKLTEVHGLFPDTTRGMLMFMYVMQIFREQWPGLAKNDAPDRVVEWIAAGEPENLKGIPDTLLRRKVK
jgi:hypothetical protein